MQAVRIAGTGMFLPEAVLESAALERRLRLSPGTIESFLGVRERRVARRDEAVSDLAVPAARQALERAGDAAARVGLTILATSTPDHPVPATAPQVAHRLGLPGGAFDLMNTCSGWLYALATASAHIATGTTPAALVVGANVLSRRLDWNGDWSTAALFGDGAGAVVLEAGDGPGRILATALDANGDGWQSIQVPAGGSRIPMSPEAVAAGQHLLRVEPRAGMLQESATMLETTARAALAKAGLTADDVDWFLPHQANARLVAMGAARLGIPPEHTLGNIERYGNTSAASLPILLHEAALDGVLQRGDRILMAAVAAGRSSAAAVVEW